MATGAKPWCLPQLPLVEEVAGCVCLGGCVSLLGVGCPSFACSRREASDSFQPAHFFSRAPRSAPRDTKWRPGRSIKACPGRGSLRRLRDAYLGRCVSLLGGGVRPLPVEGVRRLIHSTPAFFFSRAFVVGTPGLAEEPARSTEQTGSGRLLQRKTSHSSLTRGVFEVSSEWEA